MLLGFSFAAGFSIGRSWAAIPVLLVGAMAGLGRGWPALIVSLPAAAALYVACSWLLTPLVVAGELPSPLFGAWAIPLYGLLALGVFALSSSIRPPSKGEERP